MIPPNLIINADDFGLNTQRNLAIMKCFQKGLINSTSLMPNMPAFKEAVLLANDYNFKENIGLHACFTEGKSLTDLSKTPLVDKEGFFIKMQVYRPMVFISKSVRVYFKREVEAQLEALNKFEINPTHINTHHDIHELPWLLPIFLSVAKKHHIKLRVSQMWVNGKNPLKPLYRKVVNQIYKYYNLNFTDYFETLKVYEKEKSKKRNQTKITEIMVHPDLNGKGEIIDSLDPGDFKKNIMNILN
jgi:predicted glycoside hydrolase/deacetylase ChbG (UPF0249 family)